MSPVTVIMPFNVRIYACLYLPITSVKCHVTAHKKETFPPPLYLHWHCAGGAPPRSLLSHLSHPLIHLPPLCSVSLPPTAHYLLCPIITRSTSPLQLPWQQLCWVPRVAGGHKSATDRHHLMHPNKVQQDYNYCFMDTIMHESNIQTGDVLGYLDSIEYYF